jgi:hypothetical protein
MNCQVTDNIFSYVGRTSEGLLPTEFIIKYQKYHHV